MASTKGPVRRLAGRAASTSPRTGASGPLARVLSGRAAPMHVLMAELLVGAALVGIRAVADYEVQATGTLKGKIGHPKGQLGPLPVLAALIVSFFVLSFVAAGSSGIRAKVAVAFGAVIDLALALHSITEIDRVAQIFGTGFGKAKTPPAPTPATAASAPPPGATLV